MKAKHFLLASALLLWTGVLEAQTYQVPVSEKNEKMQEGEFEPTWESLQNYLKSATPFPKCYLQEKWTFDS